LFVPQLKPNDCSGAVHRGDSTGVPDARWSVSAFQSASILLRSFFCAGGGSDRPFNVRKFGMDPGKGLNKLKELAGRSYLWSWAFLGCSQLCAFSSLMSFACKRRWSRVSIEELSACKLNCNLRSTDSRSHSEGIVRAKKSWLRRAKRFGDSKRSRLNLSLTPAR